MIITPICFYPTTAIAIDDNQGFLESIASCFDGEIPYDTYTSPVNAIKLLNNSHSVNPFLAGLLIAQESDCETIIYEFNLDSIVDHINNANRFNEISTIIVDYSMPQMTGLDFCQQVNNDYLRTIMLTGEAGYEIAVDAFNKGLIDRFILKNNPDLFNDVISAVKQEQYKYFLSLTKFLLHDTGDSINVREIKKVLSDQNIANLFKETIERLNIVEYYLLGSDCDFLLLDATGHSHVLTIKSETLMNSFEELAIYGEKSSENKANIAINSLKKREKVPYFYENKCYQALVDEWDNFLHPAGKIEGLSELFYWSLLENCNDLPITFDKNLTYFADLN